MKWANSAEANAAYHKATDKLSKMHPGAFTLEELSFVFTQLSIAHNGGSITFSKGHEAENAAAARMLTRLVELSERTIGI